MTINSVNAINNGFADSTNAAPIKYRTGISGTSFSAILNVNHFKKNVSGNITPGKNSKKLVRLSNLHHPSQNLNSKYSISLSIEA